MDKETKEDKGEQSKEGFYCDVCDCIVKDSLNYLDHINGKRHNRNLGISLKKFTDSTLEEVKEMLELKRRQKNEANSAYYNPDEEEEEDDNEGSEDKVRSNDNDGDQEEEEEEQEEDEEERIRRKRREKKKRQKARKAESLYY